MTLDQLAASSGVDRGTISRIELGHVSPRIDTISFLCEAMGTDLGRFFGAAEPAPGSAPAPVQPPPAAPAAPAAPPPAAGTGPDGGYWPVPASFWHGLLEVVDRFEVLVKNSGELILVQDRLGCILYASPSCETILGARVADLVGRHFHSLVHPSDLRKYEALLDTLRPVANATGRLDCRFHRQDGSWLQVIAKFCNQFHNPNIQAVVINALELPEPAQG